MALQRKHDIFCQRSSQKRLAQFGKQDLNHRTTRCNGGNIIELQVIMLSEAMDLKTGTPFAQYPGNGKSIVKEVRRTAGIEV